MLDLIGTILIGSLAIAFFGYLLGWSVREIQYLNELEKEETQ